MIAADSNTRKNLIVFHSLPHTAPDLQEMEGGIYTKINVCHQQTISFTFISTKVAPQPHKSYFLHSSH